MPPTQVVFYRDADRRAPVVECLEDLRAADLSAYAKCRAAIVRLKEAGHELRRPTADFLRDGIYELRVRRGRVNYRLLYFFHGRSLSAGGPRRPFVGGPLVMREEGVAVLPDDGGQVDVGAGGMVRV